MDKFSVFKKCFTVVASAIITIVVFVFMIKMAVEGNTFSEYGFEKTDRLLVGTLDHYAYKDYWTIAPNAQI